MAEFKINGNDYELEFTLGAFRRQAKEVKQGNLEGLDASFSLIVAAYTFALKREGTKVTNEMKQKLQDDLDFSSMAEIQAINDYVVEVSGAGKDNDQDPN